MKKAVFAAVVVVAAAALGLPRVFGGLTESLVETRVTEINSGNALRVSLDDYVRGWFSSTADVTVRLAPEFVARLESNQAELPAWVSTDSALPVRAELGHGPLGVGGGPFLGLSSVVARPHPDAAWVDDVTGTYAMPYLFEFRGRTGFTGRLAFDADIPAVDTAATGGDTRFSGAALEGTLKGDHLVADLDVDALDIAGSGASMLLSDVQAALDTRFLGRNRNTGMVSVEIAELGFTARSPTPQSVQMSGVRLSTEGALEDGAWRSRIDLTSESITPPNGPNIESAAFGMAVDGLDAAAMAEVQALLEDSDVDPATGSQAVPQAELMAVLNEVFAGTPSLEIAPISFTRDGEAFDANLRLDVREDATPLNPGMLGAGPGAWMSLVDGSLDATVAKPLARRLARAAARAQLAAQPGQGDGNHADLAESQASLMLVMLTGQGFIEETEDAYSTRVRLTDGALTVNGQPLPTLGGMP